MRNTMTRIGLGLALVIGTAGAAAAQSTRPDVRPDSARRERAERGDPGDRSARGMRRGGPGGPGRSLLRGITLTDAQKTRLEALRKEQQPEVQKAREQFRAVMQEARDARQRGDTVTARAKMQEVRTAMAAQRERQVASLRTVLTADQQKQLDANIAALEERAAKGERHERGARPGPRGDR
jgi:Spy/CpxP family protein refolding chaperone